MNYGLLVSVILYEALVILGVGYWIHKKRAQAAQSEASGSFLLSNRDLPVAVVGVTMALTVLGTVHILGLFENAWHMGAISMWFSFGHVILLVVACLATGRWARRLGVSTMPELVEMLFGSTARLVVSCVMAAVIWGILTLECQGLGIIIATMTGWSIQNGAILGAVLGLLYVVLAGMKEIGWVNLINTVFMYLGLIVAGFALTTSLPQGWEGVTNYYINQDQDWMLSIWGTPDLMLTFALGATLSIVFCQGISQMLLQTAMSAKSEKTVKRAVWIAAPVNGLFGVFTVAMGLAAKSIPEFHAMGPKLAAPTMILNLFPFWLVAWLLASFLAAVLSTFAMTSMTPATIFTVDIYKNLFNPAATEADERRVARWGIVILSILAVGVAAFLPPIVAAINWLFAWLVPVFFLVTFGLFWKRSNGAALLTMFAAWIANCAWSFTELPHLIGLSEYPNVYITVLASLVVGVGSLMIMDTKPGLLTKRARTELKRAQETIVTA
ncbi:sodium:solute symporter family protein [Desulfovibrio inopinatus]|uniref:sodium:solute symporter family protein n=1 Tax=Desulfovibrio inopinatus TaxID=102109 RepID=UPI000419B890|nr:sodium:solute symporter family protein [Desulfovibrio inopinatus]